MTRERNRWVGFLFLLEVVARFLLLVCSALFVVVTLYLGRPFVAALWAILAAESCAGILDGPGT